MDFPCTNSRFRGAKRTLVAGLALAALCASENPAAAANPTAVQNGGTLIITGDAYSNSVTVVGSNTTPGTVGVFVVDVPWVYEDVHAILFDMKGGDDYVGLERVDIDGAAWILPGHGNNTVRVGTLGYGENSYWDGLVIVSGDGNDDIRVTDFVTNGEVIIDTLRGNDVIQWGVPEENENSVTGLSTSILGTMSIGTGDGNDRIEMWNSSISQGATAIDTGLGDDQVGLGAGFSTWAIYGNFIADLSLSTGDGADDVVIADSSLPGETLIELGNQADFLLLGAFGGAPNNFGTLDAFGGKGQDTLYVDPDNEFDDNPSFKNFELP